MGLPAWRNAVLLGLPGWIKGGISQMSSSFSIAGQNLTSTGAITTQPLGSGSRGDDATSSPRPAGRRLAPPAGGFSPRGVRYALWALAHFRSLRVPRVYLAALLSATAEHAWQLSPVSLTHAFLVIAERG